MGTSRVRTKDTHEKLVHHRLSVLQLAEVLENNSEACRGEETDPNSYLEWKYGLMKNGFAGVRGLSTPHYTHPQITPPKVVDRILQAEPESSCLGVYLDHEFAGARRDPGQPCPRLKDPRGQ